MAVYRRALYLAGAVTAAAAALLLLAATALPPRAAFTGTIHPEDHLIAPEINAIAPDFELVSLEGEQVRLSDLRGRPVILNFWATWCGPCIVEMPILQSIFEAHQDTGLRILAVNLGETADTVRRWQQTGNFSYDLLLDQPQAVARLYHLRGQPSTYVISPDGLITHIFFGPIREDALIAALEQSSGTRS